MRWKSKPKTCDSSLSLEVSATSRVLLIILFPPIYDAFLLYLMCKKLVARSICLDYKQNITDGIEKVILDLVQNEVTRLSKNQGSSIEGIKFRHQ